MRVRILLLVLLFVSSVLSAQEKNPVLTKAETAYENGRFEQVIKLLEGGEPESFSPKDKIQAYRILSLSCLYLDRQKEAEEYAGMLLSIDPFYTPYGDSPRFSDLLNRLKKVTPTVTTASKLEESIEEVPVPITLITGEMIRASGAISLQEVLLQYVPGLTAISGMEDNVAMRGVYGLSQEGILVMLDGHRLNSITLNSEPFDFRNSLDKIKRIEVLRGPASSLYGNVTLTAVVNIITLDGTDLEGGKISALTGNHGRVGGSLMFGNGNLKFDYLAWGSVYYSHGEQYDETKLKGPHYIGGYNSKPTFDLGTKFRWGDFKLEVTGRHCHPIPFYNIIDINGVYDYYKYDTVNGDGPGIARTDIRGDIDWSHKWNRFTLSVNGHASIENQQIYNTFGDTLNTYALDLIHQATGIMLLDSVGTREVIHWDSHNMGIDVNGTYQYKFRSGMSGSILAGIQYEHLAIGDASLMLGFGYANTNRTSHDVIPKNDEHTISTFVQFKHYFTDKLIFNGGVRFDHKIRLDGRQIFTSSPRASLIWLPNSILTVKGGYSHAFVDASAFYRGSNISLFSGGSDLNPEKMDSFQAGAILNWKHLGIHYEFNCFYNNVQDLVYYDSSELTKGKKLSFSNAGYLAIGGIENVFQFNRDRIFVDVNCTWQNAFDGADYYTNGNSINNVPAFSLNTTAQYAIIWNTAGSSLNIRAGFKYQTGFHCLINPMLIIGSEERKTTIWERDRNLLSAGLEWKWAKGIDISFDVRNILNKGYLTGGQLLYGFPGESLNYVLKVSWKFGR